MIVIFRGKLWPLTRGVAVCFSLFLLGGRTEKKEKEKKKKHFLWRIGEADWGGSVTGGKFRDISLTGDVIVAFHPMDLYQPGA